MQNSRSFSTFFFLALGPSGVLCEFLLSAPSCFLLYLFLWCRANKRSLSRRSLFLTISFLRASFRLCSKPPSLLAFCFSSFRAWLSSLARFFSSFLRSASSLRSILSKIQSRTFLQMEILMEQNKQNLLKDKEVWRSLKFLHFQNYKQSAWRKMSLIFIKLWPMTFHGFQSGALTT